jgi:hypothetical protein
MPFLPSSNLSESHVLASRKPGRTTFFPSSPTCSSLSPSSTLFSCTPCSTSATARLSVFSRRQRRKHTPIKLSRSARKTTTMPAHRPVIAALLKWRGSFEIVLDDEVGEEVDSSDNVFGSDGSIVCDGTGTLGVCVTNWKDSAQSYRCVSDCLHVHRISKPYLPHRLPSQLPVFLSQCHTPPRHYL